MCHDVYLKRNDDLQGLLTSGGGKHCRGGVPVYDVTPGVPTSYLCTEERNELQVHITTFNGSKMSIERKH